MNFPVRTELADDVATGISRMVIDHDAVIEDLPVMGQPPGKQIFFIEKMADHCAHIVHPEAVAAFAPANRMIMNGLQICFDSLER
jgi:hypothetical protein